MNDTKWLALLYPIVKDFPEAPLSIAILSKNFGTDEFESQKLLEFWHARGLTEKKYQTIEVYKLTQKGLAEVKAAHASTAEF